jgi:hypothetical protein
LTNENSENSSGYKAQQRALSQLIVLVAKRCALIGLVIDRLILLIWDIFA